MMTSTGADQIKIANLLYYYLLYYVSPLQHGKEDGPLQRAGRRPADQNKGVPSGDYWSLCSNPAYLVSIPDA